MVYLSLSDLLANFYIECYNKNIKQMIGLAAANTDSDHFKGWCL